MTTPVQRTPRTAIVDAVTRALPLITALAVALSLVHLIVFWFPLGINVFEFIKLSDLAIYGIPVLFLVVSILFSSAVLTFLCWHIFRPQRFFEFNFSWQWVGLLPIVTLLSACYFLSFGRFLWRHEPLTWLNLFVLASLLVFSALYLLPESVRSALRLRLPAITTRRYRYISISLSILVGFLASAEWARIRREAIVSKQGYWYIEASNLVEPSFRDSSEKLRYLGKIGDFMFF